MERIENILFPVDFTDHCREVALAVAAMAARFHAEVTLLHALDLPSGAYADWQAYLNLVDVPALHRHEVAKLDRYLVDEMKGLVTHRVVAEGGAARSIVEYARERGMDLIAIPTQGLSPFRSLLLGSVTQRVLHDSVCPVWTEAHLANGAPTPVEYHSILCALDLAPASAGVLRWAARMAKEYGARLQIIHATEEDWPEVRRFQEESFQRVAREAEVDAPFEIVGGPPLRAVIEGIRRHHADLLVIGRGHSQGALGRLRTNAHALIRQSPCPVLSV